MKCIHVLRKPCSRSAPTVAANVLRYGTGALNIGATRIHSGPSEGGSTSGETALGQGSGWNAHNNRTTAIDRTMASGRWPANLVLQHLEGCRQDGTRNVRSSDRPGHGHKLSPVHIVGPTHRHSEVRHGNLDGTETVTAWTCAEGCPVAALDAQSGTSSSAKGKQSYKRAETTSWKERGGSFTPGSEWEAEGYGDAGGASRFFKQFVGESS